MPYVDPRLAAGQAFIQLLHDVAQMIDDHLGEDALNIVVNATVIDRFGTAVAKALRSNPETAWLAAFVPAAQSLASIAYSTQYRNKSVYDAVIDHGLAHLTPIKFDASVSPEIKAMIKSYHVTMVRDLLGGRA